MIEHYLIQGNIQKESDKKDTPSPWLMRFFRSGKNPHEPNPQHLSH